MFDILKLEEEQQLLDLKRSQLRWTGLLRIPPGHLFLEVLQSLGFRETQMYWNARLEFPKEGTEEHLDTSQQLDGCAS